VLLLEGQRLFNERTDLPAQFMRISIPLWVRILRDIPAAKITGYTEELSEWMELKTKYHPEPNEVDLCKRLASDITKELKQINRPMMVHAMTIEPNEFAYTIKINYEFF
jgi:hypothetical protein